MGKVIPFPDRRVNPSGQLYAFGRVHPSGQVQTDNSAAWWTLGLIAVGLAVTEGVRYFSGMHSPSILSRTR